MFSAKTSQQNKQDLLFAAFVSLGMETFPPEPERDKTGLSCDWVKLVGIAETHGMAPLLYRYVKKTGMNVPEEMRHSLKALVLRHRLINRLRSEVSGELFTRCREQNLEILALKGAALAYLLYPSPDLRPMRDMDLLIAPWDIKPLREILNDMGFTWDAQQVQDVEKHRHYPAFTRRMDGFTITIEVHHALFQDSSGACWFHLDDLTRSPLEYSPGEGIIARTLNYEDMLFHLCQHAFREGFGLGSFKLINLVDIIYFSERFKENIDWDLIRNHYPFVLHTLSGLHELLPLSETLREQAVIPLNFKHKQAGEGYTGWPAVSITKAKEGTGKVLWNTLFPSPWWINLRYGSRKSTNSTLLWGKHLLNVINCVYSRLNGSLYE